MIRAGLRVILVAVLCWVGATASAGEIITTRPVQTFVVGGSTPMALPTSVAVGPGGEVYVADGVHNRVVIFAADGTLQGFIKQAAGKRLARPTAVATSDDGRVWITDADNRRVVVLDAAGKSGSTVELKGKWTAKVDLTDLAVTGDGSQLWLVDNDHHQLLWGRLARGRWVVLGKLGAEWGSLDHPSMIALNDAGDAYVSDVLNGRVQGYTSGGRPMRPLGSFGVSPGQFYRPRGVATRGDQVWVADSTLGVIQVLTPTGRLVDVVRQASGAILHLDNPAGIEVVGDDLYVVEMDRNRVRKFRISTTPGNPFAAAQGASQANESGGCAFCHLEMMPEFESGTGTPLIATPTSTEEDPYVSREESCLSCHDGAMVDSRRAVWQMHSHPVGEPPPADMKIPDDLPLVDGKLACRTCHSAHTLGGSGTEHRNNLMMRSSDESPSDLCTACHGPMARLGKTDALHPAHPMGKVDPAKLTLRGLAPDIKRVDCYDCHTSHGGILADLLPPRAEEEACLTCHPGQVDHKHGTEHPRGVQVTEKGAIASLKAKGGRLGRGDTVVCLSCHDMHGSVTMNERCEACHTTKTEPDDPAIVGHSKVLCASCHSSHDVTGTPRALTFATAEDPVGCLSCHGTDQVQQPIDARPGSLGHRMLDREGGLPQTDPPLEGCTSCHDAHVPSQHDPNLCTTCHSDRVEEMARGGHGQAVCLDCHPAHTDPGAAPHSADDMNPVSRRCLACHSEDADPHLRGNEETPRVAEYVHPAPVFHSGEHRWAALEELVLYSEQGQRMPPGENGDLTCGSCHLTHGPDREIPGTKRRRHGMQKPCAACHGDQALPFYLYYHRPERREPFRHPDEQGGDTSEP